MFAWVLTMFSNTRSLSSIAERSVQRTYGSGTTLHREKSHKPQALAFIQRKIRISAATIGNFTVRVSTTCQSK